MTDTNPASTTGSPVDFGAFDRPAPAPLPSFEVQFVTPNANGFRQQTLNGGSTVNDFLRALSLIHI